MRHHLWIVFVVGLGVACFSADAQETGGWRPVGNAAKFTTGYVSLAAGKLSINDESFAIVSVRPLTRDEIGVIFMLETPITDSGNLYRLKIPKSKTFLNKNAVCDGGDVDWLTTHVHGNTLELYFFTGVNVPDFSDKAQRATSGPCGAYGFARAIGR